MRPEISRGAYGAARWHIMALQVVSYSDCTSDSGPGWGSRVSLPSGHRHCLHVPAAGTWLTPLVTRGRREGASAQRAILTSPRGGAEPSSLHLLSTCYVPSLVLKQQSGEVRIIITPFLLEKKRAQFWVGSLVCLPCTERSRFQKKHESPTLQADSLPLSHLGSPRISKFHNKT